MPNPVNVRRRRVNSSHDKLGSRWSGPPTLTTEVFTGAATGARQHNATPVRRTWSERESTDGGDGGMELVALASFYAVTRISGGRQQHEKVLHN